MSELALQLIAENKKTRATFLDLGNCDLTEVPDEIGDLVWLEVLSFSNDWWDDEQWHDCRNKAARNNIFKLSNRLGQLKHLKRLFLSGNYPKTSDLAELSPLEGLKNLQLLDIRFTQIADLRSLMHLSNLQCFLLATHKSQT